MEHPDKDRIQAIACKQINGDRFTDEEIGIKDHFIECKECRDYFVDCMMFENFLSSGGMDWYYSYKFGQQEEMQPNTVEEAVLYGLRIVIDSVSKGVQIINDVVSGALIPFESDLLFSPARGAVSDVTEAIAGESLVSYDRENGILQICLDQEELGERSLQAVVRSGGQQWEKNFEDDGHGMYVAEFEGIKEDADIQIIDLCP